MKKTIMLVLTDDIMSNPFKIFDFLQSAKISGYMQGFHMFILHVISFLHDVSSSCTVFVVNDNKVT